MERKNRRRYSTLEKQELIEQWRQSGKSKTIFCKENNLGYFSFLEWIRGRKKRVVKNKNSFVAVKIKSETTTLFSQIILRNGTTINLYREVEADYLASLLKA